MTEWCYFQCTSGLPMIRLSDYNSCHQQWEENLNDIRQTRERLLQQQWFLWIELRLLPAGQPMQRPRRMRQSRRPRPQTASPALPDWWPKSSPLPSTSQVSGPIRTDLPGILLNGQKQEKIPTLGLFGVTSLKNANTTLAFSYLSV